MNLMQNWLYYLAFAVLNAHELDAMTQSEWRLLYILRDLPAEQARNLFVLLHIPLIAVIVWATFHRNARIQRWSRTAFCLFMAVHAGLHFSLTHHPAYSFTAPLSVSLIYAGGLLGAGYLLAELSSVQRVANA
jgi:hypothetical protein